ncbi:amidophosphoribosyltransferase [Bradyrhizobium nitroreducens]|uniref:Amidophosphoribosyltransferase n=1 Tax=Bradyrhizobium nitroreducens TaxID=709803 RepID=A0A2M6UHJ2_9BRAD|nr:phosphoribosyltransferase family protein [Bradyrhizobium nitroreducens]PIT04029.1 amidophosphoribosyltransferase [Bradyrhizobium nitroreducens]
MAINLDGNWKSGKAYDLHTVSSTHLGTDESGHDRFDNTRSEMGELVYQLKYKGDKSKVQQIVTLLDDIKGIEGFDFIIPIPPTKKNRPVQPVELIAEALGARRKVAVAVGALTNSGNEELKGITDPIARKELLDEALKLDASQGRFRGRKVLLVDDLYRSGSTLRVATDLLYKEGEAAQVSVLTMTKTRSNR